MTSRCPPIHDLGDRIAALIALSVEPPVILGLDIEPLGESIDRRDPHPVETTGHLVPPAAKLGPCVQDGVNDLQGVLAGALFQAHRDAAPVVLHGHRAILMDGDIYASAGSGQGLVNRIIDYLEHQMMQSAHVGAADIHARPTPDSLQSLEDLNVLYRVGRRRIGHDRCSPVCSRDPSGCSMRSR